MLNFQIGNLVSLMLLGEKMCINIRDERKTQEHERNKISNLKIEH